MLPYQSMYRYRILEFPMQPENDKINRGSELIHRRIVKTESIGN